jgi:hypothetical protein
MKEPPDQDETVTSAPPRDGNVLVVNFGTFCSSFLSGVEKKEETGVGR